MKYCILGGGGSFAIHTAFHLLDQNDTEKVIGVGRNPLRPGAFSLGIEENKKFEYHARHVTYEHDLLMELLDHEQPGVIINFAAQGERAVSFKHSWRFFETNCVGLARLAEALAERPYLRRFIQIGTSEHYGSVVGPAKEDAPINPSTPYGVSKVAFDLYLITLFNHIGFPMNILRPCNAYGPGQLLHRVIPKAIWSALKGVKFPLHGGGLAEKSFIHSHDLARAMPLVLDGPPGAIYNTGPKQSTPIKDIVAMIASKLGKHIEEIAYVTPQRIAEDQKYWLNSDAIKAIGWEQTIDWDQGLDDMIQWAVKYWPQIENASTDYVMRA